MCTSAVRDAGVPNGMANKSRKPVLAAGERADYPDHDQPRDHEVLADILVGAVTVAEDARRAALRVADER